MLARSSGGLSKAISEPLENSLEIVKTKRRIVVKERQARRSRTQVTGPENDEESRTRAPVEEMPGISAFIDDHERRYPHFGNGVEVSQRTNHQRRSPIILGWTPVFGHVKPVIWHHEQLDSTGSDERPDGASEFAAGLHCRRFSSDDHPRSPTCPALRVDGVGLGHAQVRLRFRWVWARAKTIGLGRSDGIGHIPHKLGRHTVWNPEGLEIE